MAPGAPLYSPAHSNLKHVQAPHVPVSPSGHATPRPRLLITRSHPGRAEDRTWEGHPGDTPPNQPTLGRQWARATRTAALGVLKCSPFLVSALKHAAPPPWLQCNHFHLHSRTFYRRKVSATPYPPYLGQGDGGRAIAAPGILKCFLSPTACQQGCKRAVQKKTGWPPSEGQ